MAEQKTTIDIRELRDFWHPPFRRASLGDAVKWCNAKLGYNAEGFADSLVAIGFPADSAVTSRTLHRVIKGGATADTQPPTLSCFLVALDAILRENQRPGDTEWQEHQSWVADQMRHFRKRFGTALGLSEPTAAHEPQRFANPTNISTEQILTLLSSYLHIQPEDLTGSAKYFFPAFDTSQASAEPQRAFFDCYRFHSKPGYVVKTFMVVKSPTTLVPACLFSNFFYNERTESMRRTDGIIIPTPKTVYFVGTVRAGGSGMKVLAIERSGIQQHRIHGLMISFDEDQALIASRFVMTPSKGSDHVQAGAGIHTMKSLRRAIMPFVDEMRNRVAFSLERDLRLDGEKVTQSGMVEETKRVFRQKGRARLVDVRRREFNPAADNEYTFNSALRSWRKHDGK